MKTIGFAGTFYTLWDVQVERVNVALGAWYDKVTCTYYKNLSKDLDEAIIKAGTDNIDESLRGKRKSFFYKKPLVIEPGVMTECEQLYRIILCNDRENLIDGVRQAAFERALELGYLEIISGKFLVDAPIKVEFGTGYVFKENLITYNTAYKWNCKLRYEDQWRSSTLDKIFIGII